MIDLEIREREACEMLAATPHLSDCNVSRTSQGVLARCTCARNVRAMIAFADAERERCAAIAECQAAGFRRDLEKLTSEATRACAANRMGASETIAHAIRNPLYQHGETVG